MMHMQYAAPPTIIYSDDGGALRWCVDDTLRIMISYADDSAHSIIMLLV